MLSISRAKAQHSAAMRAAIVTIFCLHSAMAVAQTTKYSAPVAPAPTSLTPPAYAPAQQPKPVTPVAPTAPAAPAERDSQAQQLSQSLPLDPATLNLRNRLPADVPGTERRLGLRVPHGRTTNLEGRNPSTQEITDALVH